MVAHQRGEWSVDGLLWQDRDRLSGAVVVARVVDHRCTRWAAAATFATQPR